MNRANRLAIVVPCYNEASRLDAGAFETALRRDPGLQFVFVDDGSSDSTAELLRTLCFGVEPDRARVLSLERNQGKAEAVRRGILSALDHADGEELDAVGYWDADLATPLSELEGFADVLQERAETRAVIGSRVKLLGRRIDRRAVRHYSGRLFATLAALTLGFPVYDTQCGAKLFRSGGETRELFATPFVSAWAFDVELLARIARRHGKDLGARRIVVEYPLQQWRDIGESKVRAVDMPRMLLDLGRIRATYR